MGNPMNLTGIAGNYHKFVMNKLSSLFLVFAIFTCSLYAKSHPVIRKEIREQNGRKVEYMFIDGIKVHESDPEKQPQPPVVEPKPYDAKSAKPPKGAFVLFDGTKKTLDNWQTGNGEPTKWKLIEGALESVRGGGYLISKQEFGSCRLHLSLIHI